jgi:hypothetical protein
MRLDHIPKIASLTTAALRIGFQHEFWRDHCHPSISRWVSPVPLKSENVLFSQNSHCNSEMSYVFNLLATKIKLVASWED